MSIPAAQYVRMSTEDQQYSISNQRAKILNYAVRNDFVIVKTYEDRGRSGVVIKQRSGLKQLLQDVIGGKTDYKVILVYDVSRWGRFQNPDEAAHYEFICSNAGIPVHYCAEQFNNDGSMPSSIMKALKRTMAAEYSRELSVKVFDGQKRIAQLGYCLGGMALYGLRRMVVTKDGHKRLLLKRGERKSITTDRIVLVPGPKSEVECIRQIFREAVDEEKTPGEIAADLVRRKIGYLPGHRWDGASVLRILKNPQYAGYSVWNRTTRRMHSKTKFNPPPQWVLRPHAFAPLVDDNTFRHAQKLIEKRRTKPAKPDAEVIGQLKRLLARKGELSHKVMKSARGLYDPRTYYTRYGSYLKLYELVGYRVPEQRLTAYRRAANSRLLRENLLDKLAQTFSNHVRVLRPRKNARKVLEVDGRLIVSIILCKQFSTPSGLQRWMLKVPPLERKNLVLVCLADLDAARVSSYFIAPPLGNTVQKRRQLAENDPWLRRGKRLGDLSEFCYAAAECERQLHPRS